MPQMSPIMWLILMILTNLTLVMSSSCIYYLIKPMIKIKKKKKNWSW